MFGMEAGGIADVSVLVSPMGLWCHLDITCCGRLLDRVYDSAVGEEETLKGLRRGRDLRGVLCQIEEGQSAFVRLVSFMHRELGGRLRLEDGMHV